MTKSLLTICTLLAILLATGKWVSGQNCTCPPNLCCRFGFCGTSFDFCGRGCQSGPCHPTPLPLNGVADIVTDAFFNGIISGARSGCAGRGFYTRAAFLSAAATFPSFGAVGSPEAHRQEIAAFFAHVSFTTGNLCYIEEINGQQNCQRSAQYPCAAGRRYYGRGPLLLSWNFNYISAGRALNFDGLNNPDIVARDPVIAFKTALYIWMNNPHTAMINGRGFGATIRALEGSLVCDGRQADVVTARVNYYTNYCNQLGVNPGNNLRC